VIETVAAWMIAIELELTEQLAVGGSFGRALMVKPALDDATFFFSARTSIRLSAPIRFRRASDFGQFFRQLGRRKTVQQEKREAQECLPSVMVEIADAPM
jgi:hypothetical protein